MATKKKDWKCHKIMNTSCQWKSLKAIANNGKAHWTGLWVGYNGVSLLPWVSGTGLLSVLYYTRSLQFGA